MSLGCREVMTFIWRLCLMVRGISMIRTISVKAMMLRPKLLKRMLYNSTRPLIIGWMIMRFQMSLITSTGRTVL